VRNKYVVVTRPNCAWCDKTKALLDEYERAYTVFSVSEYRDLVPFLREQGLKTVPQVYYMGTHIGGYEETLDWLTDGQH
jgi:glutaredoxin